MLLGIVSVGSEGITSFALAKPHLNFTDITSGPDKGIGDGLGSGSIVTVWGNNLGASQGTSKIFFQDSTSTVREASYVYYWKNADGFPPGGPADLSTYQEMQEIAFSIPDSAMGTGTIYVIVGGEMSNGLPFTVRSGNIYHVKSTGNDTNNGSFSSPWLTLSAALSGDGKVKRGDIIYTHGVGSTRDINVGAIAGLVGTNDEPFSVIVYPGTTAQVTGTISAFRNMNGGSYYLNFSKFTVSTKYQAFSLFQGSRIVGNNVTGPTINSGYSGWIGGGCAGKSPDHCGGHRIYGNEVHDYGKDDGTVDQFQHLFYISNRSGLIAEGFEIGWNYLHDNPIYQGIHIYDQEACGGWNGAIDIHNNVIKNQGGNSLNINLNCASNSTTINIYNNLTITDTGYNLPNRSAPAASLRVDVPPDTVVNVINNTFAGWGATSSLTSGSIHVHSNIWLGNRNVGYVTGAPETHSNNIFYNTNYTPILPSWHELTTTVNPLLPNYKPVEGSQAIDVANNAILTYCTTDIVGQERVPNAIDIGAFERTTEPYLTRFKIIDVTIE